jgi:Family of unknown function (DUF6134)
MSAQACPSASRMHVRPALLCVAASSCIALSSLASPPGDESSREWRFKVSLDDQPIGTHHFALRKQGEHKELTSEARFKVRILFFEAYRYEHSARELWRGECVERLDARTEDNGDVRTVRGAREDGMFRVTSGERVDAMPGCVQTFAYWNPRILEADRLLNPQTGEYVSVQTMPLGRESIAGHEQADRYRLVGRDASGAVLQIDLWYSPSREWLALESRTVDGRRLRYSME